MAYPETAPNQAEFFTAFPEFRNADPSLVASALSGAATMVDACVYGRQYGIAVAYLAAHRLAMSPWGNASKLALTNKQGLPYGTTYFAHFAEIRTSVTAFGVVA